MKPRSSIPSESAMHDRLLPLGFVLTLFGAGCSEGGSGPSSVDTDTDDAGGSGEAGAAEGVAGETGTAGEGGTGGGGYSASGGETSGGEGTSGLDDVEDACEADCEAQYETECVPPNQNELTCKLGCANVTVQLDGFCFDEYAQWVHCRADGGYDCVNGYPTPRSTCALESQAFTECTADLGCKRVCSDSIDAGCEDGPFDACVDTCVGEKGRLPGYCGIYVESFLQCQASLDLVCGAKPTMPYGNCDYHAARVGDCIYDENGDACEALCYVANAISCGTDCMNDCQARLDDVTCGAQYAELVDCELLHGDLACTDGQIVGIDVCESDYTAYQTCMAG